MKAVQVDPDWRVEVVDVAEPRLQQPDDVIVRVRRASVCGSDLRITPPGPAHRLGHEFIGTVVEIGSAVQRLRIGDQVIGACLFGCGRCGSCERGDPLGCRDWEVYGETGEVPGCQCELVRVPAGELHLAAQGGLPDEVALLLSDSLPTGWLGARAASITPDDDVLVIGLGPVGLCSVWAARHHGASRVLAVDPNPTRAALAQHLGATLLDATLSVAEQVSEHTCGRGASVVLEAVGEQETVVAAIESASMRGLVVLLGMVVRQALALPVRRVGARSLTLRGMVCAPTTAWPTLLPALSGHHEQLGAIVNHNSALADAPAVYRALRTPGGPIIKAALLP